LKLPEGTVATVPPTGGYKHPMQPGVPIDTANVLFICGGGVPGWFSHGWGWDPSKEELLRGVVAILSAEVSGLQLQDHARSIRVR
jgi:hypothetical protein